MQEISANNLSNHELEIVSETLLICESMLFHVGIPLTPDTGKRLALKSKYFSPFDDFIKSSLATITTPKLREIYQILCDQDQKDENYQKLAKKLSPLSIADLIYFPLLIATIVFSLVVSIKAPYDGITYKSLISAFISSTGALLGSSLTTTSIYRFYSFREIIKEELNRREGKIKNLPSVNIPLGI